ncbi:Uncharacterised protein [Corynebacterium renale]|uniref:GTP-binding protein n=1 Tax=Corynebacterium renale TaxID=1724 RepID=A0A2A9DNG7_9CORY|nr:hypothetical protein [Corynebacterium renale]PFG28143.1 hypothetical protein ATK06_1238 [Corynebacterium renale]SQG65266.1 Uncharacterised protein [Corynebacterium renale]SQI20378.1 Uncharacterised protein [Corynebacterium renale]STC98546.1 Uncharacterised protein [Corynebacterium renale]
MTRHRHVDGNTGLRERLDTAFIGSPSAHEVLFVGDPGIGKTTAVRTLATHEPINTEAAMSVPDGEKTTVTVGIDFGLWEDSPFGVVGLFGSPGHERFSRSRSMLANPSAGVVLWVYGDDSDEGLVNQVRYWAQAVESLASRGVVAINFATEGALDRARSAMAELGLEQVPVMTADPRFNADVVTVASAAIERSMSAQEDEE